MDRPTLCVSDLHLTDADDPRFHLLSALARLAADAQLNLLLLGDIVEVWIGDDDDAPLACAFRDLLQHTAKTTAVALMAGNRDFLYGDELAHTTGITLLPDPSPFGPDLLLSHGDRYCTDDAPYQQMRALFRDPAWQSEVLGQTLEARRTLAQGLRSQSAAANANKAANIMDVNANAVAVELEHEQRSMLLHGHTHRPGIHQEADRRRYVLGAWERTGWVSVIPPGGSPRLFCLALGQDLRRWWSAVEAQL